MPDHRTHRKLNRLVLGEDHDDVNKLLDFPWLVYRGRHRRLFHDKQTVAMIYALTRNERKAMAAALHIALDRVDSRTKAVRKMINLLG